MDHVDIESVGLALFHPTPNVIEIKKIFINARKTREREGREGGRQGRKEEERNVQAQFFLESFC